MYLFIEYHSADWAHSKNAVRFCWFSAEEFGLLGAHRYVENLTPEENLKIAMYINSDM